jgi:hypothetical protein
MATKKYRFLDIDDAIKEGVPIPTPVDLTPEEEAAILAQAKAEYDEAASETELVELLRQRELGLLVLEKEINELVRLHQENHEKPT